VKKCVTRGACALLMAGQFLSAGCADKAFVGRPGLTMTQNQSLPEPLPADLVSAPRPQVLGPFDQVSVDVFGLPEFSRTVTIDRSGNISLPLAGEILASGQTPGQLGQVVADRLRANHVRAPQVSVNVTQVVSQVITVDGAVRTPGLYPVTGRMTLLRALARAEGTTEYARENYILVFRRVNGQDIVGLYDVRAIKQGLYPDPEVFANDVVEVDESRARRIFNLVVQSAPILIAPLVAVLN
jgi:polysaccharide biosynthesis/export protein